MLKNNFEKLSLRDKILLYIIVVIGFGFLFVVLEDFLFKEDKNTKLQHNKHLSIRSLSNKIIIKNNKSILEYIEKELAKSDIFIDSIKSTKQIISLTISGDFQIVITALQELDYHLIIEEFFLNKSELDNNRVQVRVVFLNHYFLNQNKKLNGVKNIITFFENNRTKIIPKIQTQPIVIDAIIDDEVFIESEWYKKKDSYLDYKIVEIEKDFIKLLHIRTTKTKIIRLQND